MIKWLFIVTFVSALMFTENATAQSFWDMKPHEVRDLINGKILAIKADRPDVRNVNDITIKRGERGIPLRIYTPKELKHLPIILLIHGGAWVAGNLDTHDNMARSLCKEVQALGPSVGYL